MNVYTNEQTNKQNEQKITEAPEVVDEYEYTDYTYPEEVAPEVTGGNEVSWVATPISWYHPRHPLSPAAFWHFPVFILFRASMYTASSDGRI